MKVLFFWSARAHEPPFLVVETWQGTQQLEVGMELRMSILKEKVRIERIQAAVFLDHLIENKDAISSAGAGYLTEMKVYVQ